MFFPAGGNREGWQIRVCGGVCFLRLTGGSDRRNFIVAVYEKIVAAGSLWWLSTRKVLSAGGVCGWADAICGRPDSSIDSLVLVSTRSGTKLESTALHTFSLGSKRPRQVFNASPSAGGLKCLFQNLVARTWLVCWRYRRYADRTVCYCRDEGIKVIELKEMKEELLWPSIL